MATLYGPEHVVPQTILSAKVGVLGYGGQGHAHALNLKDSGCDVRVGLHEGSKSRMRAADHGFVVGSVAEIAQWADVVMFCTPDVPMRHIYAEGVAPHLRPGQTILFAHGFNIVYDLIEPPEFVDVALVSPKGPGKRLREEYQRGSGLAGLVAVHQDASGKALETALAYAWGIGCARVGLLATTFREETETDLFGEQTVLCGGIPELIKAGFETLVAAGYQPEVAFFECMHETKLIVDLLYEGGLEHMRRSISDTAEWGGYEVGPRVVGPEARAAMAEALQAIQDGSFARKIVDEMDGGGARMRRYREAEADHPVQDASRAMREMMGLEP